MRLELRSGLRSSVETSTGRVGSCSCAGRRHTSRGARLRSRLRPLTHSTPSRHGSTAATSSRRHGRFQVATSPGRSTWRTSDAECGLRRSTQPAWRSPQGSTIYARRSSRTRLPRAYGVRDGASGGYECEDDRSALWGATRHGARVDARAPGSHQWLIKGRCSGTPPSVRKPITKYRTTATTISETKATPS